MYKNQIVLSKIKKNRLSYDKDFEGGRIKGVYDFQNCHPHAQNSIFNR